MNVVRSVEQMANLKASGELYEFTGTSSTTVALNDDANSYAILSFIIYGTDGQMINSLTGPYNYFRNVTAKIFGESGSVWGSVAVSSDYKTATFNRTSSTTSKVRLVGMVRIV